MKKIYSSLLCLFYVLFSYAQTKETEKIPLIKIDQINEEIQPLLAEEKYDEVLALLDQVHPKDSAYCGILTAKSYFLIETEELDKSLEVINEGLSMNCSKKSQAGFYINKGFILNSNKEYHKAIKNFEEALKEFPKNPSIHYNIANTYKNLENYENSFAHNKRAVQYSPVMSDAHTKLAELLYESGETTWAAMIYAVSIFVQPEEEDVLKRLGRLEESVSSRNPNSYAKKNNFFTANQQNFKKLDKIINNLIVLDSNYEVDHELQYNFVKQLSAIFSELEAEKPKNDDFLLSVYYEFFKWLKQEDYFKEFIDVLSLSISDEDVQKYLGKQLKGLKDFYPKASKKYFDLVRYTNDEIDNVEDGAQPIYDYENQVVSAITSIKDGEFHGPTKTFTSSGFIKAEGNVDKGERTGEWKFYEDGKISEISTFDLTTKETDVIGFWNSGIVNYEYKLKDGQAHGIYKEYLPLGALYEQKEYDLGTQVNKQLNYFKTGEDFLEFDYSIKDGDLNGETLEYYSDGELYAKTLYENGKKHGKETNYYYDGSLMSELNFVDGEMQGEYKAYYLNGQVREQGYFENDQREGVWRNYNEDGEIEEETSYRKGEIDGIYKDFYKGKLIEEITFKNGVLKDFTAYDQDQNIIVTSKKKKGEVYYQKYDSNGVLRNEGNYDVKGGKYGEWKEYHLNGTLASVGNYEDDSPVGEFTLYHSDGESISEIKSFKDNLEHGYYQSFYTDGSLASEGWFVEGNREGQWKEYYINGNLKSDSFYEDGKLEATVERYSPEGQIYIKQKFDNNWTTQEIYYTPEGEPFDTIQLTTAEKDLKITYKSLYEREGGMDAEVMFSYGVRNGERKQYHHNNQIKFISNYLAGDLHGEVNEFYLEGEKKSEQNYLFGNLHGDIKTYYKNGNKNREAYFEFGVQKGEYVDYHENGEIDEKGYFNNGSRDGRVEYYSMKGNLELVLFYAEDYLIAYAYLDEKGEEVSPIKIENDTKVEAYFSNGQVSRSFQVVNGLYHGEYKQFYEDGQLLRQADYINGQLYGELVEFYPDGQLKRKGDVYNGDWEGELKYYYPNGNLKRLLTMKSDLNEGVSKYYNADGSLEETRYYFNNEVYKIETN